MKEIVKEGIMFCFVSACVFLLWSIGCVFLEKMPKIDDIHSSQIQKFTDDGNNKLRVSVLKLLVLKTDKKYFTKEESLSFIEHQKEYEQLNSFLLSGDRISFLERHLNKEELRLVLQNDLSPRNSPQKKEDTQ